MVDPDPERVRRLVQKIRAHTKRLSTDVIDRVPVLILDRSRGSLLNPGSVIKPTLIYSEPSGFEVYLGGVYDAVDETFIRSKNIQAVANCAVGQCEDMKRLLQLSNDTTSTIVKTEFSSGWYASNMRTVDYIALAVEDHPKFDIITPGEKLSAFLDRQRHTGRSVLIHCMQGFNRSAAMAAYWLAKHNNNNVEQTIELIARKRPEVFSNIGFIRQLIDHFDEQANGSVTGVSAADGSQPSPQMITTRSRSTFNLKDVIERF